MYRRSHLIRGSSLLPLIIAVISACSDTPISQVPDEQVIVELDPATLVVDAGQTTIVTAYVVEPTGQRTIAKSPSYSVNWSLSDSTVATLSSNGAIATVTGAAGGAASLEAEVVATESSKKVRRSISVITRPAVASIRIAGGNSQSGPVSTTLPQKLVVQALSRDGFGVRGVSVRFAVRLGNGAVTPQEIMTDEGGYARASFTLGPQPGQNAVEAWVADLPSVVFQATGAAVASFVQIHQGNLQQGAPGTVLPAPLAVRVLDASLQPLTGAQVTWTVTGGGGQITATSHSDNTGVAYATWTLGAAGANMARASVGNAYADFAASAVVSQVDQIIKVSGDAQSGLVNTRLSDSLVVRVIDGQGNPKAGVHVGWTILGGGGSVSPVERLTDSGGYARTAWTVGAVAGSGQVRATAQNVGNVTFNATIQAAGTTPPPPPAVSSLILTPQSVILNALNAQTTLAATAYDAAGNVVPGQTITWTSTNPMMASVDNLGRVTAKAVGTAMIVATALCCNKADTASVTVNQQLTSVGVSPHATSVAVGASTQLSAAGYDSNGNVIPTATITWSSSNPAVASVSSGLVQGIAAGTAYIRAVSGTHKDSAAVTVTGSTAAPVLTTITLTPSNPTLLLGAIQTFTAVGKDQNGNPMTGLSFSWSSSNTSIMTVSQGVVTALLAGIATLRVTSGTVSASTQVTVNAPAPPPSGGPFTLPDIAFADMENGTTAPFSTSSGSITGSTDISIINDPTGAFGGKVVDLQYTRTSTAQSVDVNRSIRHSLLTGVTFGQTIFIRGQVFIPTPASDMTMAMRKLIYVQRQPNDASFAVIKADGNTLKAEITKNRVFSAGAIPFNQKTSIEIQITANTAAGTANGVFRLWKNGQLVIDRSDIEWLTSSSPFKVIMFGQQTQHQLHDSSILFDEHRYWDNLAISTRRIGP